MSLIKERTKDIHEDILTEASLSQDSVEALRSYLDEQLPLVFESIREGIKSREQNEEEMRQ